MQDLDAAFNEQATLLDRLDNYANDRQRPILGSIRKRLLASKMAFESGTLEPCDARMQFSQLSAEITHLCAVIEGIRLYY